MKSSFRKYDLRTWHWHCSKPDLGIVAYHVWCCCFCVGGKLFIYIYIYIYQYKYIDLIFNYQFSGLSAGSLLGAMVLSLSMSL